jgi:hypothetical protein
VRTRSSLRSLCRSFSFAPLGLALVPLSTHRLRRGLHSCAASRLDSVSPAHFSDNDPAMTQTPPGLESLIPRFPALKRWAMFGRPSGAGFSCVSFHWIVQKLVLTHTLKRWATQNPIRSHTYIWSTLVPKSNSRGRGRPRHTKSRLFCGTQRRGSEPRPFRTTSQSHAAGGRGIPSLRLPLGFAGGFGKTGQDLTSKNTTLGWGQPRKDVASRNREDCALLTSFLPWLPLSFLPTSLPSLGGSHGKPCRFDAKVT